MIFHVVIDCPELAKRYELDIGAETEGEAKAIASARALRDGKGRGLGKALGKMRHAVALVEVAKYAQAVELEPGA